MPAIQFEGIYAANVLPMNTDYSIDEAALVKHIAAVSAVDGIHGLLVNGHAGENFLTSAVEKERVIKICRASAKKDCVLVAGVNAENSLDAARQARSASDAGADAILIFPPNSWALGPHPETVLNHHRFIIDACDLPIMLYQAPVSAGAMAYDNELLRALVQLPRIVGIKEGSWEVATYEANRRLVKDLTPHVAVMASGDEHLMTGFMLGSDGSQVSLAVVIPEIIVELDKAVRCGDLATAKRMHEVIYPLAKAIYGTAPGSFATARLKQCLQHLGRIPNAVCRPPIGPLPNEEVSKLNDLLARGLLSSTGY